MGGGGDLSLISIFICIFDFVTLYGVFMFIT